MSKMYPSDLLRDFVDKQRQKGAATGSVPFQTCSTFLNDRPLRPLTAYNIFFLLQRERIIRYGLNNNSEHEGIPYTIDDMERVVRERYENWAGIVPLNSISTTSFKAKESQNTTTTIPSFGELSHQVGLAWKKLDKDTKNLFSSFASKIKKQYHSNNSNETTSNETSTMVSLQSICSPVSSPVQNRVYRNPNSVSTMKDLIDGSNNFGFTNMKSIGANSRMNIPIQTNSIHDGLVQVGVDAVERIPLRCHLDNRDGFEWKDALNTIKQQEQQKQRRHQQKYGSYSTPTMKLHRTSNGNMLQQHKKAIMAARYQMCKQYHSMMSRQYDAMMENIVKSFPLPRQHDASTYHVKANEFSALEDDASLIEVANVNIDCRHHNQASDTSVPLYRNNITTVANDQYLMDDLIPTDSRNEQLLFPNTSTDSNSLYEIDDDLTPVYYESMFWE